MAASAPYRSRFKLAAACAIMTVIIGASLGRQSKPMRRSAFVAVPVTEELDRNASAATTFCALPNKTGSRMPSEYGVSPWLRPRTNSRWCCSSSE